MQISVRNRTALLLLCLSSIVTCSQTPPVETGTPSVNLASGDECANYNGPFYRSLRKSLLGRRDRARKVARKIQDMQELGKDHTESGQSVLLTPICESNDLDRGDLKSGRFVGLLTGPGTYPRFSVIRDDTVAWWVFGESVKTQMGDDTTIWHSQFLSLKAPADSAYLKSDLLMVCANPAVEKDGHPQEEVRWHAGKCDEVEHTARGDKPWFGCKLGCCFSAMLDN